MIKKTIAVTGAGGYIGSHVVSSLCDSGFSVTAIDTNTELVDKRANCLQLDIFDTNINVYQDLGFPEICLHLAWKNGFNHNSEDHINFLPKHYEFLRNMIGGGLPHLAVLGTMHEIGYWEGEVNDETPTNPKTLYGISKNTLRQILQEEARVKNLRFQWLRAFYIIGNDSRNKSVFSKILEFEKEGKATFPFTTGENKYDFITIEDLTRQIIACISQTAITGVINCCSGVPVSLREMVTRFLTENNLKIKPQYGAFPSRPYDSPAIWGNAERINKILASNAKAEKLK